MGNIKSKSIILGVVAALAGSFLFGNVFFSHSAYAASYINVSSGSGGTVSFGSIKPTSTGTSATASDTLTVHTDCSVGYSVYVSGQNGKDTNLTNKTASSDNVISTSSNTIGSAGSLSSNTWGLNYENTGTYVGLPTYSDSTNKALTTKTSVDEESTVPIYYGLKVNTALTPGTYTGDVLYTVIMDSSCQAYTVIFNSNGGTGTMASQSIMAGTATKLTANSFVRSGYTFLGWSTDSSATTATYADEESVTDLATGGSSITLYAIWQKSDGTMQGWTGCSALSVGEATTLTDTRDNKVYTVKKLPDGKCWMVQNLTINGAELTPANTNIDNNTTYYLPKDGGAGSITDASTKDATTGYNFASGSDNQAMFKFRAKNNSIINDSDTGYYNFYTATLGFSYYGDDASSGSSTRDICPKNWRLPYTTDAGTTVSTIDASNDYTYLARQYSTDGWQGAATSTSYQINDSTSAVHTGIHTRIAANGNTYAGFSYPGYWDGTDSSASFLDSRGYYWSSSVHDTRFSYFLTFASSYIYPQTCGGKYSGIAVRCISQDNYTINYSSDGADSGEASKTSETVFQNNGTVNITMPTAGTLTKDSYDFKGWALTSGATTAAYQAEETVTLSDLLATASSAGQTTTAGSTITLYPVWAQSFDMTTMQGWAASNGCNALSTNQYLTLKDSRDGEKYVIKKLADGKCWMVQNLRLVGERKLTSADSDVSSDFTLTASTPDPNTTNWCMIDDVDCLEKSKVYYNSSETSDSSKTSYYGALYNWYTATAGTGTYSMTSGNASSSICPKGWRLPIGGPNGDFADLDIAWGGDGSNRSNANTYGAFTGAYSSGSNGGFEIAGYVSRFVSGVGLYGLYWSSTARGSNYALPLEVGVSDSSVYPQHYDRKFDGLSVRCIANVSTMQATSAGNLAELTTTALKDSRDEQTYTVYRWPTSGTAGTDYPTGMAGYAIMTKDLSLGYVTGGSIAKGTDLTLTTDTSASAATIIARTGASDWSSTRTDDNKQYINGPQSGKEEYSSHSYYSYGAAQSVCPKGWSLFDKTQLDSIIDFMGGNTEAGAKKIGGAPYNFVHGGYFAPYGSIWYYVGSYGYYPSAQEASASAGWVLDFNSSNLYEYDLNKELGISVRCIAR